MKPEGKYNFRLPIVRWTTRVLSILSIGMLLLFFFGEADFTQPITLTTREWVQVMFFPLGVMAGMILGWRHEGAGALVTLLSLAAFYTADFLFTGTFPGGPYFLLFSLPGILFGVTRLVSRSMKDKPISG